MSRRNLEGPIHDAILRYLRLRFPRGLVVHAANELDMAGPAAARQVAKAKHRGMVPGWPDLMLLLPEGEMVAFEIKAPGGVVSPAQKGVMYALNRLGFRAAVVRSIRDVEECLEEWDVDALAGWKVVTATPAEPERGDNWQRLGTVVWRTQGSLAKRLADARNESGDACATNATHPLTINANMRGSRDG